jgi:RNA polymerase sigma-70 factor (ECF subfamily)
VNSAEAVAHSVIERAARESYGKLCAILAIRTGDLMRAEDALADALVSALEHWPVSGIPASPEGWLMTTARRKIMDLERHDVVQRTFLAATFADMCAAGVEPAKHADDSGDSALADPRLRLLFACTHPALDPGIRTPLMLQVVLGFDAKRIAAAFLWSPSAMAQRLVRAKHKIRDAGIPFSVPSAESLPDRIDAVLRAVYAAYGHGWADPIGADADRRDFVEEAIWLGRTLLQLCPDDAEVRGLLALMLYFESRRHTRRNDAGDFVPLAEQPTERWDHSLIDEAEALLDSARSFGRIGRFQLEAAIQSVHATRARSGTTDWPAIVRLYDALYTILPSPVVAINRAVAIAETDSATTALIALASIDDDARMRTYQPYWAARAELLARTGDVSGAAVAYSQAIGLSEDPSVRRFLAGRRAMLVGA